MTDTTAQIKAKGCSGTGITEELARRFHDQLGLKMMAIVEFRSTQTHEEVGGKQKVDLEVLSIEPAIDEAGAAEEHLRGLQRAIYMNRKLHSEDAQPTLDSTDDIEPKVSDVIAAQAGAVPHDFVREGKSGNCEVCGNDPFHQLHTTDEANEPAEHTEPEPASS